MAIRATNQMEDIEIETAAALDALERGCQGESSIIERLESVRGLLDRVEERVIRGPEDVLANAEDLRDSRRILFETDVPAALLRTKLALVHRLWRWERFLR